ncbi:MAG: alpha-ribazole phosphatase [Prevotella sp.]|nr:alpha-ribazole phosphatase [Prevotella sp.]
MEVTLIRHTSVGVPKGTCYGWTDVPLADTFIEEAENTKQQLQGLIFNQVFSSPLSRARKLAAYCGYPNPIIDERLKEMNMGDWEMRTFDEIERNDPHIQEWFDDYMHQPTTTGESYPQLYQRVSNFLDELRRKPFEHVAIFAHGGVLVSAGVYAGIFPADNPFQFMVPYGGIIHITI